MCCFSQQKQQQWEEEMKAIEQKAQRQYEEQMKKVNVLCSSFTCAMHFYNLFVH